MSLNKHRLPPIRKCLPHFPKVKKTLPSIFLKVLFLQVAWLLLLSDMIKEDQKSV